MVLHRSRTSPCQECVDGRWVDSNASNRTPPTRASQRQTKTVYDKEWSFLPQAHTTFTLKHGTSLSVVSDV